MVGVDLVGTRGLGRVLAGQSCLFFFLLGTWASELVLTVDGALVLTSPVSLSSVLFWAPGGHVCSF